MNVYMIHIHAQHVWASIHTHTRTREPVEICLMRSNACVEQSRCRVCSHTYTHAHCTHTHARVQATIYKDEAAAGKSSPCSHSYSLTTPFFVESPNCLDRPTHCPSTVRTNRLKKECGQHECGLTGYTGLMEPRTLTHLHSLRCEGVLRVILS